MALCLYNRYPQLSLECHHHQSLSLSNLVCHRHPCQLVLRRLVPSQLHLVYHRHLNLHPSSLVYRRRLYLLVYMALCLYIQRLQLSLGYRRRHCLYLGNLVCHLRLYQQDYLDSNLLPLRQEYRRRQSQPPQNQEYHRHPYRLILLYYLSIHLHHNLLLATKYLLCQVLLLQCIHMDLMGLYLFHLVFRRHHNLLPTMLLLALNFDLLIQMNMGCLD